MCTTEQPAKAPLRTVAEHQALVAALIRRPNATTVPLADAVGRVLATSVTSSRALPGFANSAMDGYAVRTTDVAGASPGSPVALPMVEDIPAGRSDGPPLEPGTVHRIMTGAAVPTGCDAVIPVEATNGSTDTVLFFAAARPGQHIRAAGEDVTAGESVLAAGQVLGPPQVALLSALGRPEATVVPPLRVLVLSTGSELVEPGQPLKRGEIYESNGIMLAAAVRQAGGLAQQLRFVPDDVDHFLAALREHAAANDLIITSGGVSAGAYEVVKDALTHNGVEFAKVAMQPGMPQGAGSFEGTPIITLPGNPVSALVSFEVFIRPALRAAMGYTSTTRPLVMATLAEPVSSPLGKRQFRRGVLDRAAGTVTPIGPPASHFLRWMASANCLIDLGEETTDIAAGAVVPVWDVEQHN